MKAILAAVGALGLLAASHSAASAQWFPPCRPQAPDACGPGMYYSHPCGMIYGPSYNVRPPFPPFQGLLPVPKKDACPEMLFPTHPYARGPRDYFMLER